MFDILLLDCGIQLTGTGGVFMIFISHQHKDKEFVGDIAQTLSDIFGEEKVFFDDWSIKPGENIVNRMNTGLEECKYFFFFVTRNSLESEMVNLEWTSTLIDKANRQIEFIPIRADDVNVPQILKSIKYLDLYSNGMDTIKTQIIEIVQGQETNRKYPTYQNLEAYVLRESEKELKFFIKAKRFFEPNGKFVLVTKLDDTQAEFNLIGGGMTRNSFNPNAAQLGGENANVFFLEIPEGVKKGFKIGLSFIKKVSSDVDIALFHMKTESKFERIPTTLINSENDIPTS